MSLRKRMGYKGCQRYPPPVDTIVARVNAKALKYSLNVQLIEIMSMDKKILLHDFNETRKKTLLLFVPIEIKCNVLVR